MKVDVVIPLYNTGRFIEAALRSIEAQTRRPDQVIVVDDGSTDDGPARVLAYAADSAMRIDLLTRTHVGLSAARNAGIEHSDADWVAFLDADDEWRQDKIEKQLALVSQSEFPDLGMVYCGYEMIDQDGLSASSQILVFMIEKEMRGHVFDKMFDANKIAGSGSGVLVKRACFLSAGLFDVEMSALEDWDMWVRIARVFAIDYVDEPLVRIRRHRYNMQHDRFRMQRNLALFAIKWSGMLGDHASATLSLGGKLFDYVFKELFLMRPRQAYRLLTMLKEQISPSLLNSMVPGCNGSIYIAAWITLPRYVIKQSRRMLFAITRCLS